MGGWQCSVDSPHCSVLHIEAAQVSLLGNCAEKISPPASCERLQTWTLNNCDSLTLCHHYRNDSKLPKMQQEVVF